MTRTAAIAPITGPRTDLLLDSPLPLLLVPSPPGGLGAGSAPVLVLAALVLEALGGLAPLEVVWVGSSEETGVFGSLVGWVEVGVGKVVVVTTGTVVEVVVGFVTGGITGEVMTGVVLVGNDIVVAK